MSVNVPAADLSAATTGTTGTLSWPTLVQTGAPVGVRQGRPVLRLFNESGCGLAYTIGADGARLPAGGWVDIELSGQTSLDYLVEYVLPGQPVSLLLGTIYEAGEKIPALPQLGNSPIGIGGSVATSGVGGTDHILNTGNAPGTSTYSATPNDQSGASFGDTNDGAGFRRILSAGVLRIILNAVRGNATTGKASVQLGDSGDTAMTVFYGSIGAGSVVPASTISGTLPAGQLGSGYPGGSVSGAVASASSATTAGGVSNGGDADVVAGSQTYRFDSAGTLHFPFGSDIAGISGFGGNGSATVNHGLGQQPRAVCANTLNGSNSTTYGSGSYNATSCFVYQFNSQPWVAIAYV